MSNDIGEAQTCARCSHDSSGCKCVGRGGESGPFSTILVSTVSFNHTRYYTIKEEDKPYIREIRSVFCYNPESATHLCELTPSYDLRYLHTYIVLEGDASEEKRGELDSRYCHEDNEDTYMHVSDVRQFAKDHPTYHKECGEFDSIEDAVEHLNGNWPF